MPKVQQVDVAVRLFGVVNNRTLGLVGSPARRAERVLRALVTFTCEIGANHPCCLHVLIQLTYTSTTVVGSGLSNAVR